MKTNLLNDLGNNIDIGLDTLQRVGTDTAGGGGRMKSPVPPSPPHNVGIRFTSYCVICVPVHVHRYWLCV